ncbi:MAG TPA: phosphate signaling complex protein PhoU [Steroidobacteraceae bacterium]|nr:phosphate signaling complex protein PhoU [Steroidobacteraceae bacterium]
MSVDGLTHHISSRYNEDLQRLLSNVLAMGGLVERQLLQAVEAITDPDEEAVVRVAKGELRVNQLEREIDEDCSRILATRSPTASDLRLILTILKTITDLERIGDEGEKIAGIATRLAARERPRNRYRELRNLGELVIGMVHDTLDAFARHDTELALEVLRRDRIVDEEYESIHRQSITFMMEDPRWIRRALDVMWVVRSLERIGDHSKNVCEYLIYLVHGRDVRHVRIEEIERELSESEHGEAAESARSAPGGARPASAEPPGADSPAVQPADGELSGGYAHVATLPAGGRPGMLGAAGLPSSAAGK